MKIFKQPATYVVLVVMAIMLAAHYFDFVPNLVAKVAFWIGFGLFGFGVVAGISSWVTQDVLPAWRRKREARKQAQEAAAQPARPFKLEGIVPHDADISLLTYSELNELQFKLNTKLRLTSPDSEAFVSTRILLQRVEARLVEVREQLNSSSNA